MRNAKIYYERAKRLHDRVTNEIYSQAHGLQVKFTHDKIEPIPVSKLNTRKWKELKVKQKWADTWACAWFIFEGKVPTEHAGKEVGVYIDIQGEACVFKNTGKTSPNLFDLNKPLTPYAGLTNKIHWSLQSGKFYLPLFKKAKGGENISLLAEAGANGLFGKDKDEYLLERADIVVFDREKYQLLMDLKVLISLYENLEESSVRKKRVLHALNEIANNYQDGNNMDKCREIAKEILSSPAVPSALTAWSIGHAHIDLAWLWPIRETKRKASRTFSTALRMMETYPDYTFGASQAQLYQWTKDNYPQLYCEIKKQIEKNRWEVQGASWVEHDTNMPSGESLVRQYMYGKRFFREEFGKEFDYLFLPDCFGFTGSLPQILKQAGVNYFISQKLSWNDTNKFPHSSFIWEGIDGSKIKTHFLPTHDYNFSNLPGDFIKSEKRFEQADICNDFLNLYGIGDGGGGPSSEHIELAVRQQNCEGVPRVKFGFVSDFLKTLDDKEETLPVWKGELYFELHRGTYTTQGLMKKNNRMLEQRLQQLEFISVISEQDIREKIEPIWKDVLLNQFHDIIPGSSIGWVYKDANALSESNLKLCKEIEEEMIFAEFEKGNNAYLFINSQPWRRRELIELDEESPVVLVDAEDKEIPSFWADGKIKALVECQAMGYQVVYKMACPLISCNDYSSDASVLENNYLIVKLDQDGCINRIFDKENNREVLTGQANKLQMWEDLPNNWGAWDINNFYRETKPIQPVLIERKLLEANALVKKIKQVFKVGNSTIEQIISLKSQSKLIQIDNVVDWQEKHKMLRVGAETNIQSMYSNAEVQFGLMQRPTHQNTSWDEAKFEILAHRFIDLSQEDYGFAVLNDCKYGHSVQGGTIEINLLRSPADVDPDADIHQHSFTFGYYPHIGNLEKSDTLQKAHNLNSPLVVYPISTDKGIKDTPYFSIEGRNVKIDTVKHSDLEKDSLILRCYETMGTSTRINITSKKYKIKEAFLCNLLGENIHAIISFDNTLMLDFKPFEIKTIKIKKGK
ncbi:MAG TPA: glycoside hydrolase family 38 C-terminal domain-containing protein [Candidatus Cloacimonadota bacterium]|nr:glycoside hydrolase family 38 C-terminal domain-containing protein [Candidatus Cloacimonadota bacterium]